MANTALNKPAAKGGSFLLESLPLRTFLLPRT